MNDQQTTNALNAIANNLQRLIHSQTNNSAPLVKELSNISKSLREIKEQLKQLVSNTKK